MSPLSAVKILWFWTLAQQVSCVAAGLAAPASSRTGEGQLRQDAVREWGFHKGCELRPASSTGRERKRRPVRTEGPVRRRDPSGTGAAGSLRLASAPAARGPAAEGVGRKASEKRTDAPLLGDSVRVRPWRPCRHSREGCRARETSLGQEAPVAHVRPRLVGSTGPGSTCSPHASRWQGLPRAGCSPTPQTGLPRPRGRRRHGRTDGRTDGFSGPDALTSCCSPASQGTAPPRPAGTPPAVSGLPLPLSISFPTPE